MKEQLQAAPEDGRKARSANKRDACSRTTHPNSIVSLSVPVPPAEGCTAGVADEATALAIMIVRDCVDWQDVSAKGHLAKEIYGSASELETQDADTKLKTNRSRARRPVPETRGKVPRVVHAEHIDRNSTKQRNAHSFSLRSCQIIGGQRQCRPAQTSAAAARTMSCPPLRTPVRLPANASAASRRLSRTSCQTMHHPIRPAWKAGE